TSANQLRGGSIGMIGHPVILMKSRDVPGNVRRNRGDEIRSSPQLEFGIIKARDYQGDDLFPEASFMDHLHGLENVVNHSSQLPIVTVAHRLQIDLVTVGPGPKIVQHLWRGVPIRDERSAKTSGPRLLKNLYRPFRGDQRFVIARTYHGCSV